MILAGIAGGISTVTSLSNALGLGSSDSVKEAERIRSIDDYKRAAIDAGTNTSRPYIQLACWAGASRASAEYQQALVFGMVEPGQDCRIGSDSALAYAKVALTAVKAALLGNRTAAPIITAVVEQRIRSDAPVFLGVLAAVAVAWWLWQRRGR